jgi:putative methionine-R-sulfoxide reductase with GAF domain
MALLGIDDTTAEKNKINTETEARAEIVTPLQKQQIERGQVGLEADKIALAARKGGPENHPPASS